MNERTNKCVCVCVCVCVFVCVCNLHVAKEFGNLRGQPLAQFFRFHVPFAFIHTLQLPVQGLVRV